MALPPLRTHSDLAALAQRLLWAVDPLLTFDEGAIAVLKAHDWPGGIHELRTRMTRAALHAEGRVIRYGDLADLTRKERTTPDNSGVCPSCCGVPWKEQQCRLVRAEVSASEGNMAQAARRMGMSRTMIYKHLWHQAGEQLGWRA